MLTHQDPSMAVGGVHRHDISVIRDSEYHNVRTQRELDELETSKGRHCMKKTAKFLFSHIGLVVLVGVYAVAGGFLFELLEQHQEKLNCQEAQGQMMVEMTVLKQQIVAYVQYNTTPTPSTPLSLPTATYITAKDNATVAYSKIGEMLYNFRDFVISTSSNYRYSGDDCSTINKWTYPNSLLFAITIITTIGYGNITPVTCKDESSFPIAFENLQKCLLGEGQICCICYATIGIPIFLLCVANISGVLGEMFRFLYAKVLCRPCYIIKRRRALARKAKLEEESGIDSHRRRQNGWTIDDNNTHGNSKKKGGNTFMNDSTRDEDDHHGRNQRITVPLTITMLIIVAYIFIGSAIFHEFEGWSLIQSAYFCFITLATIGFGDFVPGQSKNDPNAGGKLVLGAIYVLFGMAILAMCFDLMQEEIVAKFRWIGRKVGIIDKEENAVVNPNEKASPRRPSTASSIADAHSTHTNGRMIDDENENGWPTQRSTPTGRKLSPRNNIARVHPMASGSNEGTLHQRAPSIKTN